MAIQKESKRIQKTESSSLAKRIIDYLDSPISVVEKLKLIDTLLFSFTLKVDLLIDKRLTEREQECFRLLALGYDTHYAAEVLNISQRTMERHSASIKEKLNSNNLIQAIMEGIKFGYLPSDVKKL